MKHHALLARLSALRTEMADLAYVLDRRRDPAAADVAMTVSARLGELCEEFDPARPATTVAGAHGLVR